MVISNIWNGDLFLYNWSWAKSHLANYCHRLISHLHFLKLFPDAKITAKYPIAQVAPGLFLFPQYLKKILVNLLLVKGRLLALQFPTLHFKVIDWIQNVITSFVSFVNQSVPSICQQQDQHGDNEHSKLKSHSLHLHISITSRSHSNTITVRVSERLVGCSRVK